MADKPSRGLADVIAASTAVSDIDGLAGLLFYRGYDIHQLAGAATFEEVAYLLQRGHAPSAAELDGYRAEVAGGRGLGKLVTACLADVAASQGPMEALRTLVSLASADDPDKNSNSPEANARKAVRLTAQQPLLVAAYHAARSGRDLPPPAAELGLAANFLLQVRGTPPTGHEARMLDTCLVLHADHTMNASTFAARVCAATLSDMHSAVVAAIATLKGPLHGGANEQVLNMLREIGSVENVPAYIARVKNGELRLMGFGHRVYKNFDPRATIIKGVADEVFEVTGRNPLLDIALELERIALDDDYFISHKLYPNVDFYSGIIYQAMGFPVAMFPVLFAIGRMPGWLAQWQEGSADPEQKIARPRQIYVGETMRHLDGEGEGA